MALSARLGVAAALLATALLGYPLATGDLTRSVWYAAVALGSVGLGAWGVLAHRPLRSRGWWLVLSGFAGWALADTATHVEQRLLGIDSYPVPSDAFFLVAYALVTLGLLDMVRTRRSSRDRTVLFDAAVVAIALGEVAVVFVIGPIAEESSLSLFGQVVASFYPVGDIMLIAVLLRMWASPGRPTAAFALLTGAFALRLVGDFFWNIRVVSTAEVASGVAIDLLWLTSYLLVGVAACASSMRLLVAEPEPQDLELSNTRRRLALLAGALVLPGVTLLLASDSAVHTARITVGVGFLALTLCLLGSMASLVRTVEEQAVQLAALARVDALTGAPNRRTWDHELLRASDAARESRRPLCVALIDLDHFKRYNDAHGHQAGDAVLKDAVRRWTAALGEGAMLARYGGEEFGVLLPGRTPDQARAEVDALRAETPERQTFSGGVALWDGREEPVAAVARADAALYEAKQAGRDRVLAALPTTETESLTPTIVLQPIVDLRTGEAVAVEALSRFPDRTPEQAFGAARRSGGGPALEAAAIRAAMEHRRPGRMLSVNVSLEALGTAEVLDALPEDLSGVMLEITEDVDAIATQELDRVIASLRARGAHIAIDDWGQGYSNLDRLLQMEPEMVKLDMSLVRHLDQPYHRAVVRAIVGWADEVGVAVCAEGVETETQRRLLEDLGVRTAQGYLFARPAPPAALDDLVRVAGA